ALAGPEAGPVAAARRARDRLGEAGVGHARLPAGERAAARPRREAPAVPLVALLPEREREDRLAARHRRKPAGLRRRVAARDQRRGGERAGEERAGRAGASELL